MRKKVGAEFYLKRPMRLAFDIFRAWAVIAAALTVCFAFPHPGVWLAAVPLIGCQLYALQILHHDGMHRTLVRRRSRNEAITRFLLSYPLFEVLKPFRRKHFDHHRHLGEEADPDRYYHVTRGKETRLHFLVFLMGLQSVLATLGRAVSSPTAPRQSSSDAEAAPDWETRLDWIGVLVTQAGIAVLLTWFGGWLAYPILWVAPFGIGVFMAQNVRSFAEHAQPEPDATADTHRLVSYRSSWLERVFLAPHNMNYHAEHHLYPQVPYYHLPALREHLCETGELDACELRDSYVGFLLRFWRALPIDTTGTAAATAAGP